MTDEEKKAIEILKNFTIKEGYKKCSVLDRETCVVNGSDCIDEAIEIALNLIQKQQAELKKKDKIIDLMERFIADLDIDEDICKHQVAEFCEGTDGVSLDICVKCINQYFEKKVERDEYE